ncbi:MAG: KEOPS complex subunit Cgi121 [Candidatus Bathyarchaeota archaeon]|nr:KEOPS complex subunit Cgi121 [Candidatus Bathyarchaeota archaeon]
MLRYIEEMGKYVEITAFRNVEIANVEDLLKALDRIKQKHVWVQVLDAERVATWQHLYFAVLNALIAFKNKRNLSKNLAMEVMLYASAQRQIQKAVNIIGLKQDSKNIAAVIVGDDQNAVKAGLAAVADAVGGIHDESILELSEEKVLRLRETFTISEQELEAVKRKDDSEQALVKLIIERVALLATRL